MSQNSTLYPPSNPRPGRLFGVLCVLSGVNAGYGVLSGIITAISPPDVDSTYIDNLFEQLEKFKLPIPDLQDEVKEYYLNIMLNMGNLGAANFLFFAIQFIGVVMMFRLNKTGFILYIIAQLGLAAAPILFGSFNRFGKITFGMTLIWSLIWISLYAFQLKKINR